MTYVEGDPGHIAVHESIRLLFMAAGLDPSLIPAEAVLGGTTHITDHNKIADALTWLDDNGIIGGSPVVNEGASTNVTFSTLTDPDGDGIDYRLARWTTNGTLVVTTPGLAQIMMISGGPGGVGVTPAQPGCGGGIVDGAHALPSGTLTVTVGAGGAYNAPGGESAIGALTAVDAAFSATKSSSAGTTTHAYMYHNSIRGSASEYGLTRYYFATDDLGASVPRANHGDGGAVGGAGSSGVVMARWKV